MMSAATASMRPSSRGSAWSFSQPRLMASVPWDMHADSTRKQSTLWIVSSPKARRLPMSEASPGLNASSLFRNDRANWDSMRLPLLPCVAPGELEELIAEFDRAEAPSGGGHGRWSTVPSSFACRYYPSAREHPEKLRSSYRL